MWHYLIDAVGYSTLLGSGIWVILQWQGRRWLPENATLAAVEQHLIYKGELWDGESGGRNQDFHKKLTVNGKELINIYFDFDFNNGDFNYCSVNGERVPGWWGRRLLKASRSNHYRLKKIVDALKPQDTPLQIEMSERR